MMLGGHLLSVVIWLPIISGFILLGLGTHEALAKRLALIVCSPATVLSS